MRYLTVNSFFLSALIHLFCFSCIVFTFPVDKPPHKPKFIFLGSILKNYDIDNIYIEGKIKKESISGKDHICININSTAKPFYKENIGKPVLLKEFEQPEKIILKSTFESVKEKKQKKPEKEPLEIITAPYKPLKLDL